MRLSKYHRRIALLLGCLLVIFLPFIFKSPHLMHILILAGLESIVVMGFVAQYHVRLISFSAATFMGMGAYISAILATKFGADFWLCLPLAGLGTGVFSFALGSLIIRGGFHTFIMISLVFSEVFVQALGQISVLGGWDGIVGIPRPAIGSFVFVSKPAYYYLTLGLTSGCALVFAAFYKSAIGEAWTAINQDPDLAASVGIDLVKYRMVAYVTAGFTSGLCGSLYAHYSCYLVPRTFGIIRSLYVSIDAAVGGLNFFICGPITGSIIMRALPEYLRITDKYEPIFEGIMIILIALFFRKGVIGIFRKRSARGL